MISERWCFRLKSTNTIKRTVLLNQRNRFLDHPISERVIGTLEEPARFVGFFVLKSRKTKTSIGAECESEGGLDVLV